MRRFFRSLFGASSKEVNGIIVLVMVFLLTLSYPIIHRIFMDEITFLNLNDANKLDSLVALLSQTNPITTEEREVFRFNPNKVSEAELQRLGFTAIATRQLINYRLKGGIFRIKDDLYRIYAIDSALVTALYSYIDLPLSIKTLGGIQKKEISSREAAAAEKMVLKDVPKLQKFDLNKADTAMLKTVYGIGSVLSKRLVDFRDKLGGFVSEAQLYEVYNLDTIVIDSLLKVSYLIDTIEIKKIPINSITEKKLAAHPYISWNQARLIIAYRNQHGAFQTEADLLKVYLLEEFDINRLMPYLQFD